MVIVVPLPTLESISNSSILLLQAGQVQCLGCRVSVLHASQHRQYPTTVLRDGDNPATVSDSWTQNDFSASGVFDDVSQISDMAVAMTVSSPEKPTCSAIFAEMTPRRYLRQSEFERGFRSLWFSRD
jgi:hypothetical protein